MLLRLSCQLEPSSLQDFRFDFCPIFSCPHPPLRLPSVFGSAGVLRVQRQPLGDRAQAQRPPRAQGLPQDPCKRTCLHRGNPRFIGLAARPPPSLYLCRTQLRQPRPEKCGLTTRIGRACVILVGVTSSKPPGQPNRRNYIVNRTPPRRGNSRETSRPIKTPRLPQNTCSCYSPDSRDALRLTKCQDAALVTGTLGDMGYPSSPPR